MAAFPSDGVHPREAGAGRPLLATLFSPISINGLTLPNRVMMNGLHPGATHEMGWRDLTV